MSAIKGEWRGKGFEVSHTWGSPSRGYISGGCCCIKLPHSYWKEWLNHCSVSWLGSAEQLCWSCLGFFHASAIRWWPGWTAPFSLSQSLSFPQGLSLSLLSGTSGFPRVFQAGEAEATSCLKRLGRALVWHHFCFRLVSTKPSPTQGGQGTTQDVNSRRPGSLGPSLRLATTNSVCFIKLLWGLSKLTYMKFL